jgi:hypothetical protein
MVCSKTTDSVQFIRELNINAALQSAAKNLYNITKQEELIHFTSHLICVSACIALHAAGINSFNIKHALHWESDSFLTYLCNLPCQAQRTSHAVTETQIHFKGITLHLLSRMIAWSPVPAEIR